MATASTPSENSEVSREQAESTIDAAFADAMDQVATEPQSTPAAVEEPKPAETASVPEENTNADRMVEPDWKKLYSDSSREARRLKDELEKKPFVPQPQAPQLDEQQTQAIQYLKQLGFLRTEDAEALAEQKAAEIVSQTVQPFHRKTETEALNGFYIAHPELSPANDPDNSKWNIVHQFYQRLAPSNAQDPYGDLADRLESAWFLANKDSLVDKARNEGKSQALVKQKMASNTSVGGGTAPTGKVAPKLSPVAQQLEDEWGISDIEIPESMKAKPFVTRGSTSISQ